MKTKEYIDSLFADYEEDAALADFKEELQSNMEARIKTMTDKGISGQQAFQSATMELNNISAIAEEISLKKKQAVYEDMYMGLRSYMTPWRAVLYIICGAAVAFGLIAACLAWFFSGMPEAFAGTLLPFCAAPIACFTYLGLTQETAIREPMKRTRALCYTFVVAGFVFGIIVFALTCLNAGLPSAIATLIPFALPCAAIAAYLILTEKDRSKAWVKTQRDAARKESNERLSNPMHAKQYGLLTGALWIFAIAVFAVLTFAAGVKFSWITFVVAIALQLLIEFSMNKRLQR